MNKTKLFILSVVMSLLPAVTNAQLDIRVSDIELVYPSISSVTLKLGSTTRTGLPTPIVIDDYLKNGLKWFCLDPLQVMYTENSNLPWNAEIDYNSTNPSSFDKWTPNAPGLTTAHIQDLADLFKAYTPSTATLAGAMQIAIWEITNEFNSNSYDVYHGQLKITAGNSTMISTAQNMLNSLNTSGIENKGKVNDLDFLIDGFYSTGGKHPTTTAIQDLVSWNPDAIPIPEPSTYALFGVSLLGVIVGVRRVRATANSLA